MISDVHPKLLVKSIEFAACNFTNFFFVCAVRPSGYQQQVGRALAQQGDVKLWMERWFVRFFRHCNLESALPHFFLVGDGDILFGGRNLLKKKNMDLQMAFFGGRFFFHNLELGTRVEKKTTMSCTFLALCCDHLMFA